MASHTGAKRLLGGVAIVGGAVGLLGSVTGRLPSIIAAMFYPTAVSTPNSKGQSSAQSAAGTALSWATAPVRWIWKNIPGTNWFGL
jgi:hypothetical protein